MTLDAQEKAATVTAAAPLPPARSETPAKPVTIGGRAQRVRKNLRQGLELAWAASPVSLVKYSLLGMVSSAMPEMATSSWSSPWMTWIMSATTSAKAATGKSF